MTNKEIKINVGCGPTGKIKGFDNLDNSPNILFSKTLFLKKILFRFGLITEYQYRVNWSEVIWCDASKKLPYRDQSVSKIYSSHFLEHIPHDKGFIFLKECYRVLKTDGVVRLVVPDLYLHAEKYVESTKKLLDYTSLPNNRDVHDKFLDTIYGAFLKKKRYGAEHYYMYDLPKLVSLLMKVGFKIIKKFRIS